MHIRHVSIEGIRRFGSGDEGVDVSLPPRGWTVLAGPNGSGKTTFLKVLALALSPTLQDSFTDTMFTWVGKGARHARSRVTLVPAREDKLAPTEGGTAEIRAAGELLVGDDWGPVHGAMSHGRESAGQRAFRGPWSPNPRGWFAVGYGAHLHLRGQASVSEPWASATTREGAFLTLFRDGAALAEPIRWLMDLDHKRLDNQLPASERMDAARVGHAVIALLNDGLLQEMKVLRVDSRGLLVRQAERDLYLTDLGSAAQALVAVVVDILRHMQARFGRLRFAKHQTHSVVQHSGVVLIDEAESHLHPQWQRRLGGWLCQHFPNVQFIVSTHSPFVCQAATDGGLVLFPAPGSPEPVRVADADVQRRVVNGSADDALLSALFGLGHTWSDEAETKRERLATLEAKVLAARATTADRHEYKKLLAEIPQTMSDEIDRISLALPTTKVASSRKR